MLELTSSRLRSSSLISVALMFLGSLVGCGGHPTTGTTLVGQIRVTADSSSISAGMTTQLHAMNTNSAGQTSDVTSTVSWSSSAPTVAVVSTTGAMTGMSAGTATITATLNGVYGSLGASIGAPAVTGLVLQPLTTNVYTHAKQPYFAVATYANNTTGNANAATQFSVAPSSVASIDATGTLTAVAPGSFTVTAVTGSSTAKATGTVVDAPVSSVVVTPSNPSIAGGTKQQFTATATYADGSTADISKSFNWASSDTTLLTIDSTGLATAVGTTGSVTVTGQFGSTSAKVTVTLTSAATIRALLVLPTSSSIATGSAEQHTATAIYSDGSQADVTGQVTWSVVPALPAPAKIRSGTVVHAQARAVAQDGLSAMGTAVVDQTGVDRAGTPGTAAVQATMAGVASQSTVIVTAAKVQSLSIRATRDLFPVGAVQPIQLIGQFSDGTSQDLSLTANWASSNPGVATIDQKGLAMGVSAGNVVFTGSFGGLTASTVGYQVLSSSLVSVILSVDHPVSSVGTSQKPHVTGVYGDGKTHDLTTLAKLVSSDPSIVSVDSTGSAYSKAAGATQLVATVGGLTAVVSVAALPTTVTSVDITPSNAALAQGTTLALGALAHFTNGATVNLTTEAVWQSEDPTVLTIDSNGVAKAGRVGTTRVLATVQGFTQESGDIQVTGAKMVAMIVLPDGPLEQGVVPNYQIGVFTGVHFIALAIFDDNSFQEITRDVVWSVSDFTTASVDTTGLVLGMKPGTVQLIATAGVFSDNLPVIVTGATLKSAYLTPGGDKVPSLVARQYKMMGTFSDGTVQDLTREAVWLAPTPTIADVETGGQVVGIQPGVASVNAQYGYYGASTPVTVTGAKLVATVLTPANLTDRRFTLAQYVNTGTFDDGQTLDLVLETVFSSSSPQVAEVLTDGKTFTRMPGTTQMTAAAGGMTAATGLTVTSNVVSSMAVTPGTPTILPGTTQQFAATATFDDGTVSDVSRLTQWTSSNPAVLSVDANGLATAHTASVATTVTLTADFYNAPLPDTLATTTITIPAGTAPTLVSLAVTPQSARIGTNQTQQFTATGTYTDQSTQNLTSKVTWTTSDANVMTVSAAGLGLPGNVGQTTVTATLGALTANAGVSVVPAATVTGLVTIPTSSSIASGSAEQHRAIATYSDGSQVDVTKQVAWSVTSPLAGSARTGGLHALAVAAAGTSTVASVNETGMDTAVLPGTAMVQASLGSVTSQSTVIVTAATVTSLAIRATRDLFPVGSTQPVQLIGTFSDGSIQDLTLTANWVSSNPAVATIDQTGTATGLKAGAVVFSAGFGGLTASTIGYQVLPSTLIATSLSIDYPFLPLGANQQVHLIGTYSNGTTQDLTALATWQSSNASVFPINAATGLGFGLGQGSVQITGTVAGRNAVLDVAVADFKLQSVAVYPAIQKLAHNTKRDFIAVGFFSNGVAAEITSVAVWRSNDPTILTVDGAGRAKTGRTGTTQITATFLGLTGVSADVTVTSANLSKLTIQGATPQLAALTGQHYTATGIFDDGSFQDLTNNVVWNTSDNTVASIDAQGFGIGMKAGQVQVTAALQGLTASTPLTVTSATMNGLLLKPGNTEVPLGVGRQFFAIATFSDGTQEDVSREVIWTAQAPGIAAVILKGEVFGNGVGIGSISAQYSSFTASTPVTVTAATLTGISIAPLATTIRKGTVQTFTATGTFSDGFTQDLFLDAGFFTSDQNVGVFFNDAIAGGSGIGTITVGASYRNLTATTTMQVTSDVLSSLSVSPANPSILLGATQQFTATGTFADGTTGDVTATTTWVSGNPLLLSIDGNGLAKALSLTGLSANAEARALTANPLAANPQAASPATVPVTGTSGGQSRTVNATILPAGAPTVTSIAVTPANSQVAKGTTGQLTATATYSDGSTGDVSSSATWTSANTGVATVNATGMVTGVAAGSTSVTATVGLTSGSATVQVTPATLSSIAVTPTSPSFAKGTTTQFYVTGTYSDGTTQDLTGSSSYASSNQGVVSVSSGGLANGVGTGSAQVTISSGGKTVTTGTVQVTPATLTSIAVTPSNPSFAKGTTTQFHVTGTYSDGTTQDLTGSSSYTSSNQGVVSVGSNGLASGVGTGSAQVTITSGGQTVTTGAVTVTAATLSSLSVTPTSAHAAAGTMVQLTATGTYSDGSTADVSSNATWTTSDQTLATVNTTGQVTGVSAGLATITATAGSSTSSATVRVSAATLTSVAISPNSASFAAGTTQKFTMTGTFSDGSTQDLSNASTWTSSNTGVATVDATGLVTGVTTGSVAFSASYNGQTATTATVTVAPATLVSIAVTPANPSFAKGTTTQFHVTGTYSDGSMRDLTGSATFTSSAPAVVSISSTGAGQGLTTGSAQITVAAGGQTAMTGTVMVTPAVLSSIAITPSTPSFAAGTTQQFAATGTFSDGSTQDLSSQVVWTSSNPQVMTIGSTGVASSFQVGTAQVTASLNGTTAMTGTVHITPATLSSVTISPSSVQIAKGTVKQMTATGMYTDGTMQNITTSVTWTTSDGTVAAVNANGLATGTGLGSATLTASLQGQTASTSTFQVTAATLVSIAFNPANPTVAAGSSAQVMIIGTFSDGSTQDLSSAAMYTSSNPSAATANGGVLTGVGPGSSTISVQVNGVTSSFTAVVSNATLVSIAITPTNPAAVAKGTTEQFTATGTYSDGSTQNLTSTVSWSSSNTSAVSVSSLGLATGTGIGSGQLTATYQGQTATTPSFQGTPATVSSLSVTPANQSLTAGGGQQFFATATYTDGTTQDVSTSVAWSTNNASVATISSTGFVSAASAGNVAVKAQLQTLASSVNLTVTSGTVTAQQVVVAAANGVTQGSVGATIQFTATLVYSNQSTQDVTQQATWTSTNTGVATVNAAGLVTLVGGGTASIQGQFHGMTGSQTITVSTQAATLQTIAISPSPASSAVGLTQQFTAKGTYSDGSTKDLTSLVTWQSATTSIATINSSGLASCVSSGQVSIQASYQGQTAQSTLTVSAATLQSLSVTPTSVTLANGTKQQFTATGTLSDGSTQDFTSSVTWSSSNTSLGTVNAMGLATGVGVGQTTITAQAGSISSTASMTVTSATATSVQLTPASVTIPVGGVQQMQATAMFSDGTSQDVTNSVTYTSSNTSIVTVDANGKLKGVATGTASVTATLGSASVTVRVDVSTSTLTSLAITPANVSLASGLNQQLTATGTFADGSTQDLSQTVIWTSSNMQVAPVTSTGKLTASQTGTATITAKTDSLTATDRVTVTAAVVNAISVSPASTTLAAGQTQQFAATASFTDGSQQNVTSSANWSVSDPSKGTISNSGSTKGFLTSSATGMLNVTATLNSTAGSVPVTVLAAALTSLKVTPNPVSVPAGTTQALTVTGTYTDGSTQNVTASTTWTSGSASVATVNTSGVLHGITAGTTSVTARVGSTSATDQVTVTAAVLSSISVIPSAPSVALGLHQQMTATGTYTDGSTMDITAQVQWSSSSASVATISGTGLVSTLHTGTSTLTATLNSISGTAALTVTPASLQSIAVTSGSSSFALGLSLQLYATGTYSDGTTQNLTNSVTWSSSAPMTGMVSSTGLATGVTTGGFTARATMSGVTGTLPLTVTAAVLQTIVVTPANQIIVNVLGTTQFTATGHYSDGTTQNITNSVHWAVSGPANVGTINQSGQLSGVSVGVAGTVTATSGMISGSTGFTVVGI